MSDKTSRFDVSATRTNHRYYGTVTILIEAVTNVDKDTGIKTPTKHLYTESGRDSTQNDSLSGTIVKLPGFERNTVLKPEANLAEITGGVNILLICISILNTTDVGSFQVPLLAEVN